MAKSNLLTNPNYNTLANSVHSRWFNNKKATTIKYNLTSKDVVYGIIRPVYNSDTESELTLKELEGVISGQFKFSFRVYIDSAGDVTFAINKTARFVPITLMISALHRILIEQDRRFKNPGGGPPKGIHIKAISTTTPINQTTDLDGYNLALKSGLYHNEFINFGKRLNVAGRIK